MSKEIRTKAEMAKEGNSCVLSLLFIAGIGLYFIYPPLSIIAGIIFIYWAYNSSKEINQLEKSGQVYLGEKAELLNLENINSNSTPFSVVVDVETTGLLVDDTVPTIKKVKANPNWYPRIVQIAWITLNRNYEVVTQENFYIKQTEPIPEDAIKIHGISNEICDTKGVEITEVLLKFKQSIADCDYVVGHNVMFDKYVIEAECIKNAIPKPFKYMKKYDTMVMGRSIQKRRKFKLEDLAKSIFGNDLNSNNKIKFHDAKSDVWLTSSIFVALHKNDIKF